MNGNTHTIRRRLSVIALTASLAAVAIPAATAGGKHEAGRVLGPGLTTVEKQGPYGAYWIRKHEAARVLGPGLNTVEKRGPYGAYWVAKAAQINPEFTPSIVDRLVGSPDPRDSVDQGLNAPSMDEVHLYPRGSADGSLSTASIVDRTLGSQDPRDTYREVLGDAGFGVQKANVQDVFESTAAIDAASANWAAKGKLLDVDGQPRLAILANVALEHGAAGFGNSTRVRIGLFKPGSVNYSHLPQEDRPSGITRRGI